MLNDEILAALVFAAAAYKTKSLDLSGTAAALAMALLILYFESFSWFALMLLFFAIGTLSTKFYSRRKEKMDLGHEVRGYRNVVANGLVAVVGAYLHSFPFYLGAIAAVTADTLSCEIGELSKKKPLLITTLKPVKAGTNGAVSPLGEVAALLGGLLVGWVAVLMGLGGPRIMAVSAIAALVGANFDSFLGATLERPGLLNKHKVNLLCSLAGAAAGVLLLP